MSRRRSSGGSGQLAPEIADAINSYSPSRQTVKDPSAVAELLAFARPLIAPADPANVVEARNMMTTLFGLAQWARTKGIPLRASVVLHHQNVRAWILDENKSRGEGWKKGTLRWAKRVARAAGADGWPRNEIVLERAGPAEPYDADQEASFRQQAAQRHRMHRGHRLMVVAGSAGCGLSGPEIRQVRKRDLEDLGGGRIAVRVGGRHPRLVPCRAEYTPTLEMAASSTGDDHTPLVTGAGRNRVYQVADGFDARDGGGLSLPRARSTWLRAHLAAGTPLPALRRIAGPVSADTLKALAAPISDALGDDTAARQGLGP